MFSLLFLTGSLKDLHSLVHSSFHREKKKKGLCICIGLNTVQEGCICLSKVDHCHCCMISSGGARSSVSQVVSSVAQIKN